MQLIARIASWQQAPCSTTARRQKIKPDARTGTRNARHGEIASRHCLATLHRKARMDDALRIHLMDAHQRFTIRHAHQPLIYREGAHSR